MYVFNTSIHARPADVTAGDTIELAGLTLPTLIVPHESLSQPFAISFEEVVDRLNQFERMFTEPDGSFVWTSPQAGPHWQVDGNLFDRSGRLLFVDLKGNCPAERFDDLLAAFGWPGTPLIFQLTLEAVFLDEPTFRRWALR